MGVGKGMEIRWSVFRWKVNHWQKRLTPCQRKYDRGDNWAARGRGIKEEAGKAGQWKKVRREWVDKS